MKRRWRNKREDTSEAVRSQGDEVKRQLTDQGRAVRRQWRVKERQWKCRGKAMSYSVGADEFQSCLRTVSVVVAVKRQRQHSARAVKDRERWRSMVKHMSSLTGERGWDVGGRVERGLNTHPRCAVRACRIESTQRCVCVHG